MIHAKVSLTLQNPRTPKDIKLLCRKCLKGSPEKCKTNNSSKTFSAVSMIVILQPSISLCPLVKVMIKLFFIDITFIGINLTLF